MGSFKYIIGETPPAVSPNPIRQCNVAFEVPEGVPWKPLPNYLSHKLSRRSLFARSSLLRDLRVKKIGHGQGQGTGTGTIKVA